MYRVEISAFQGRLPHNVFVMAIVNRRLEMIGGNEVHANFCKHYERHTPFSVDPQ